MDERVVSEGCHRYARLEGDPEEVRVRVKEIEAKYEWASRAGALSERDGATFVYLGCVSEEVKRSLGCLRHFHIRGCEELVQDRVEELEREYPYPGYGTHVVSSDDEETVVFVGTSD